MKALLAALTISALGVSVNASASASVTPAHAAHKSSDLSIANATCPYRTINYITHSLPQQCLTSTRRIISTATEFNLTDGQTAVETSPAVQNTTVGAGAGSDSHASISLDQSESLTATEIQAASPSITTSTSTAAAVPSDEAEEPSPLEDDKFMSFEDWKRQNLRKAGQSEHVGRDKPEAQGQRRRPVNIHTALDSLGDDAEIDLDFSGFIPEGPELASTSTPTGSGEQGTAQPDVAASVTPGARSRSKDAGTTCKERFNYASFDCAANILKSNPEAKSSGAVLGENKDSYMLNVCSAKKKFLIFELCDDILIDTIVLANFEFFSSIFRTFRVSVSDKYPVKTDKWKTIGTFEARNTRDVQAFLVENPMIWARYVRIEFLTHYGSEYYCPVSLVRVHGTTMLEEYKRDSALQQAEDDDDNDILGSEVPAEETLVPDAIAEPIRQGKGEQIIRPCEQDAQDSQTEQVDSVATTQDTPSQAPTRPLTTPTTVGRDAEEWLQSGTSISTSLPPALFSPGTPIETCPASPAAVFSSLSLPLGSSRVTCGFNTTDENRTLATNSTAMKTSSISIGTSSMAKRDISKVDISSKPQAASNSKTTTNATSSDRQKGSTSTSQSHAAVPTMQESFFKSVQKRLQMLEANSSLSLQYIEDQSRALRDAFNKVEQRQLAKTTNFLDYLNTTVLSELRDFRQQYDQLWQSTVIELEMQRELYQQENAAINARLGVLADELIFQKRISILQMVLILISLGLVLFAKGTLNQYLEMPIVQSVLLRSPSSRWLNPTNLDTPTQSPPVTRQGSFRKRQSILKGHRRMQSEDSIEDSISPNEPYSPRTPNSFGEQSDGEPVKEKELKEPEFDPSEIERPSTSPPILSSTEVPSTPELNGIKDYDTIDSRMELGLSSPPPPPEIQRDGLLPRLVVEEAMPPPKHLTWKLPDS